MTLFTPNSLDGLEPLFLTYFKYSAFPALQHETGETEATLRLRIISRVRKLINALSESAKFQAGLLIRFEGAGTRVSFPAVNSDHGPS